MIVKTSGECRRKVQATATPLKSTSCCSCDLMYSFPDRIWLRRITGIIINNQPTIHKNI